MEFTQKKILILGLGESGLAMAQWLHHQGAILRVADTRQVPDRLPALQALSSAIEFVNGEFGVDLLEDIDVVFVSPGLSPLVELCRIESLAGERNIPIRGEIELFSLALKYLHQTQNYSPKIIAITGTNGKTTVTNLVGLLCERAGKKVKVAGNISPAMLDVLTQCLDEKELPEIWVLELSSFQLHTNMSLLADTATVLNVTQDHLDWHGDVANYSKDKSHIFGATTIQVLNRDDALVMAMKKPTHHVSNEPITFGVTPPTHAGDFGLVNEQGITWLAVAIAADEVQESNRKRKKEVAEVEVKINRLMPTDALQIRGLHNATNALAALALCRAIGLPLAPLLHGLRDYKGEPHRVELVTTITGVQYIDDSKGTNVGATIAALQGLGSEYVGSNSESQKRIILIAGGEGKGQDFSPLALPVLKYVKAVILIGNAAEEISTALAATEVEMFQEPTLEQAVLTASTMAKQGDLVLLSPACASFDMFKNYAHRAQVFVDAVREVALSCGEVC